MPRPLQGRILPWIERLVQSYGDAERSDSSRLKAHVIGVGHMSQSQAQGTEGPTGLLFLSDEEVQIPAVLTATAWDHLQDQEDRECFTSLVNTTVYIHNYQLQFHMAPEQTKSRFFLLIGELATTAAGPMRTNTPCCTSLQTVRTKICQTWRSLLGQEDSQRSQCGLDLSELLGEWQHDCLLTVLDDVREKLAETRKNPRPGTSTSAPSGAGPATGWDLDRVRYKGLKPFVVPVKQLLIPEVHQQQSRRLQDAAAVHDELSEDRITLTLSEDSTSSADEAERRLAFPGALDLRRQTNDGVPEEEHQRAVTGTLDHDLTPLTNPWDMFPRPCDTSSSDTSPTGTQTPPSGRHAHTVFTSTQLPVHASDQSQRPSLSEAEPSFLPPYQKPPLSASRPTPPGTASSSEPSHPNISVQERKTPDETAVENTDGRTSRTAKRRRSAVNPETLWVVGGDDRGDAQSSSPPSWLFKSQAQSQEGGACCQGLTVKKRAPAAHSDGRAFAYAYGVRGDDLLDLSRFRVADSLVHWAVKYLIAPKDADPSSHAAGAVASGGGGRVDVEMNE